MLLRQTALRRATLTLATLAALAGCAKPAPESRDASAKAGAAKATAKPSAAAAKPSAAVVLPSPTADAPAQAPQAPHAPGQPTPPAQPPRPAHAPGQPPPAAPQPSAAPARAPAPTPPGPAGAPAAALPGGAPAGAAATPDADTPTAAGVGRAVVDFVAFLEGKPVKLLEARRDGVLFRVTYASDDDKATKRKVWVSGDGRFVTTQLVDIETRVDHMNEFRTWTDCMRAKGVRLYIDGTTKDGAQQRQELGPFGQELLFDCSGRRKAACAAHQMTAFPTLVWPKGQEVGLQKRDKLAARFGCRIRLFQEIAAPAHATAASVGERVRRMHEKAAVAPVDLVSSRKDGAVFRVVLARDRHHPQFTEIMVSADGTYIFDAPVELTVERAAVTRSRAFIACLQNAETFVFVRSSDKASLKWAAQFGADIRVVTADCDSAKAKAECKKRGVAGVPAISRGKTRLGPPLTVDDLEALSGCKR